MFTDIVGYSSMMERDEKNAMEIVEEHNRILLPLIEDFNGTTVDAIGDGLLVVFDSVFSACNCGLTIQGAIANYNENAEAGRGFSIRIGIHMGDIWEEGERIYGNGVNITARILPFARPGGICVSDDVHRQLINKTDAKFMHLGARNLKNIQTPIVCHELVTGYEGPSVEVSRGGTDIVQEKLEAKLDSLRDKRLAGKGGGVEEKPGFESKLERRIYGFVENVIDKALDKWENVPQEKRQELIGDFKKEEWYSDGHLTINLGKSKKKQAPEEEEHREERESKDDSRELIPVGIVATAGFGAALIWFNLWWLVFPMIFIGLMPLGIGISHLISRRKRQRCEMEQLPIRQEKLVLDAARRRNGRLSVMQLSAESGMGLAEAQVVLDDMAKKGYIGQEIDENGLISYVFPELLDGDDPPKLL